MSGLKRYLDKKASEITDYINKISPDLEDVRSAWNVARVIAYSNLTNNGGPSSDVERLFELVSMHPESCGHYLRHIAILDAITIAAARAVSVGEISLKDARAIDFAARHQKMRLYGILYNLADHSGDDEDDEIYKCY